MRNLLFHDSGNFVFPETRFSNKIMTNSLFEYGNLLMLKNIQNLNLDT